jgi:hypothetical protein
MNALYNIKVDNNRDMKIVRVRVFLENNPDKVAKLTQLYNTRP